MWDTAVVTDYRPPPTEIPICWLTGDVTLRLDQPFNYAEVTQSGANAASDRNASAIAEVGVFPFYATLSTIIEADTASLASWIVDYQAAPRMRAPTLTIDLLASGRTDTEIAMLLGIRRFSRIRLTGVPAEFPEGASSLIVTGSTHDRGVRVRRLKLTTRSVIGSTPGTPGPWFRIGSSLIDGTDVIPF
jgi:hypothetical protein